MDETHTSERAVAALRAEVPGPVAGLFALGETRWGVEVRAAGWPDYAGMGLTREHAKAIGRLLLDERLTVLDDMGADAEAGWVTVHLPRALARVGGDAAATPLIEALRLADEDGRIGASLGEEFEELMSVIGTGALPALFAVLQDPALGWYAFSFCASAVVRLVQDEGHATGRARLVEMLRAGLTAEMGAGVEDDGVATKNAVRVDRLAILGCVDALPLIEQAFAAGALDTFHCGRFAVVQALAEGRGHDGDYVAALDALHAVDADDDRTREEWRADWNESRGSTRAEKLGNTKAQKRDRKKKRKQKKR